MKRFLLVLGSAVAPTLAWAIELMPIPPENSQPISAALVEAVAKVEKLPVKLTLNPEACKGMASDDQQQALMIVGAKEIKDDRDNPEMMKETGAPIGILFLSNLLPGDLKDKKKLFTVEYTMEDGSKREVRFGILTVRKYSDDDFKLQLLGVDGKPVAEGPISEEESDKKDPISIEYDAANGELEIVLLGKYPTYLPVKEAKF